MKQLITTLLILISFPIIGECAPRSLALMKHEAAKVMAKQQARTKGKQSLASNGLELLKEENQLAILGYRTGGFAVIAKDDTFNAVLGYSDSKLTDNMPPALLWWIETMNTSLEKILADGGQQESVLPDKELKAEVSTLLTTQWDQSEPYYNSCPTYTNGTRTDHYVTGCVATAMAQIMNYYKYPATGSGYNSYTISPNGTTTIKVKAMFDGVEYDWANMLDRYSRGNYNDVQANAVATLMFHCGVSVNMKYNTTANGGSGALSSDAATALRKYFSYSTKIYHREYFPVKEWMNIIYKELDAKRPLQYGGQSREGGHAFVFDGYNADGLVHVNWGWSGSGDGYFDIATLNGYSSYQDMIIIHPLDNEANRIAYTSLWGLDGNFTVSVQGRQSLTYKAEGIYNFDIDTFTGAIALVAEPINGGEVTVLQKVSASNVEYLRGTTNYGGTADISKLPEGIYRVYLATKSEDETAWQPIRSHENSTNNYILTIEGSGATLAAGDSNWTASGIDVVRTSNTTGGLIRVYTADGVMVYSASTDKFRISDIPAHGLLIIKGEGTVKKVFK